MIDLRVLQLLSQRLPTERRKLLPFCRGFFLLLFAGMYGRSVSLHFLSTWSVYCRLVSDTYRATRYLVGASLITGPDLAKATSLICTNKDIPGLLPAFYTCFFDRTIIMGVLSQHLLSTFFFGSMAQLAILDGVQEESN